MKKQPRITILLLYGLVLVMVFAAVSRLAKPEAVQTVPYSRVVKLFEDEQVKSFVIKDNVLTMELNKPLNGQDVVQETQRQSWSQINLTVSSMGIMT